MVENNWARHGFTFLILDRQCLLKVDLGLPWWLSGKESSCQCRRHRFNPWFGKTPQATEQLSQCVTTTEPVLWSRRAAATESLCHSCWSLFTLECMLCSKRRHCNEKPAPPLESRPCPLQLGKSQLSNEHPAQPKIKTNKCNYLLKSGSCLRMKIGSVEKKSFMESL